MIGGGISEGDCSLRSVDEVIVVQWEYVLRSGLCSLGVLVFIRLLNTNYLNRVPLKTADLLVFCFVRT